MRSSVVVLVLLASSGCDLVRDNDPLALDPDVVMFQGFAYADSGAVYAIAGFPHRPAAAPVPLVLTANSGGDVVTFDVLEDGCPLNVPISGPTPQTRRGAYACARASFSRALAPGDSVTVQITAPSSTSHARTTVPGHPVILQPDGDVELQADGSSRLGSFQLEVSSAPGIGRLELRLDSVTATNAQGETRIDCVLRTNPFQGAPIPADREITVDFLTISCRAGFVAQRIDLKLTVHGYTAEYDRFLSYNRQGTIRTPYPSFGTEGAAGFFAGSASSNAVAVTINR